VRGVDRFEALFEIARRCVRGAALCAKLFALFYDASHLALFLAEPRSEQRNVRIGVSEQRLQRLDLALLFEFVGQSVDRLRPRFVQRAP
jgi:hypothetical protein